MRTPKRLPAIALIIVGFVFLAKNLGWLGGVTLNRWWPAILIAVGVAMLVGACKPKTPKAPKAPKPSLS